MYTTEITPTSPALLRPNDWGASSPRLIIEEQYNTARDALRDLERHHQLKIHLDSTSVDATVWITDVLKEIYEASRPLKMILANRPELSRRFLTYWEVFSQVISAHAIAAFSARREAAKARSSASLKVTVGAMIVGDNSGDIARAVGRVMNRIEFNASCQIKYNYIATYDKRATHDETILHNKEKEKWFTGVDGDGMMTAANMRAWANRIAMTIRVCDLIVIASAADYKVNDIAFALSNLAAGGSAVIRIPRISSGAVVAMIHLFSQCFEKSYIIHTISEDETFLCGENYMRPMSARYKKLLAAYCESEPGETAYTPFSPTYVLEDAYAETVGAVSKALSAINSWRYETYRQILRHNTYLISSASMRSFAGHAARYLSEEYSDNSEKWSMATDFKFV